VKVAPLSGEIGDDDGSVGRFSLDKTFRGDLEGTSLGHMLGHRTSVDGSAGYVALERVEGALNGRLGSFVLQHSGTMNRGALVLNVTVVPDSGTDDLAGLRGSMSIDVVDGRHEYEFEYAFDAD